MKTFTHVLVPLDGSALANQSIPYARYLAGAEGRISLLRVTQESTDLRYAAELAGVPLDMLRDEMKNEAQTLLNDTADTLRLTLLADVEVDTTVVLGDASEQILHAAEHQHADFIVMTSHARGAIGRAAFGSVADRVSRTSPIPVVITRLHDEPLPEDFGVIRRLIVPLDGSDLAREAIPVAKKIALHLGCSVRLLHVIDTFALYIAATGIPITQPMLDEWRETTHAMLEPTATELKQAGIEASIEVLEGSPAELLMSVAEPGDLYVMTSHGRRGATRWVLGSVAEKLVRSAPAPVCLVPARVPSPNTPGQESPANLAPTS